MTTCWLDLLYADEHLAHLLVVRDTVDSQVFPVYVRNDENLAARIAQKTSSGVYKLVCRYSKLASGEND